MWFGCETSTLSISDAMRAKVASTFALPGLSPVCDKPINARFDGDDAERSGPIFDSAMHSG